MAPTGLGNRTGVLAGADWRGEHGYVVAPPSVHPSGRVYAWEPGWGPDEQAVRPAPAWLLDLVRPSPVPGAPPGGRAGTRLTPVAPGDRRAAYGRHALAAEVGRVAMAPVGARNDTLNRSAFSLGQLVAGGLLDAADAVAALLTVAGRAGLDEREAEAAIRSGMAAGMANPRGLPS